MEPTPTPSRSVRPGRVALGVFGTLGALALVSGLGAGAYFGGPVAVQAYKMSRPAVEPMLPDADPVAVAAQAELEESGGAAWSGAFASPEREVESYEGRISHEGGECATHTVQTNLPDDFSPETRRSEYVRVGDRSAVQNDGRWVEGDPHFTLSSSLFLEVFAPRGGCTMVEELSRTTDDLVEQADVPGLPAAAPGTRRYVGDPTLERVRTVHANHIYHVYLDLLGREPTRGEMEMAQPDFVKTVEKTDVFALDVAADGRPSAVWLAMGESWTMMEFESFGPQTVEFPSDVAPAPEQGDLLEEVAGSLE